MLCSLINVHHQSRKNQEKIKFHLHKPCGAGENRNFFDTNNFSAMALARKDPWIFTLTLSFLYCLKKIAPVSLHWGFHSLLKVKILLAIKFWPFCFRVLPQGSGFAVGIWMISQSGNIIHCCVDC
ncbi:hypothetical protein QL285_095077 [Trifolium repens]|nr:hypothetical protein QL285_095077 [Trifolium repens]